MMIDEKKSDNILNMNSREKINNYIKGKSDKKKFLYSPNWGCYYPGYFLGKKWLSEVTLEEQVDVALEFKFDLIHNVFRDVFIENIEPLKWKISEKIETDKRRVIRRYFDTPFGRLENETTELPDNGCTLTKSPIKKEEDYKKLSYYVKLIREYAEDLGREVTRVRRVIGDRAAFTVIVSNPFEGFFLVPREDPIYHEIEWPEAFVAFMQEAHETEKKIIEVALKNGTDGIFLGSVGTEMISPRIFEEYFLTASTELCELTEGLGGWSNYHVCGCGKKWIDSGYVNSIKPTVYESFSLPPTGDITDFRIARKAIDKRIVSKGHINLNLLKNGTPEEVSVETKKSILSMKGFRHIISTNCQILHGTPKENLEAMYDAYCDLIK
ncbi:MAG: hypothetical protein MJB12_06110 [Firmicutes bacterium]|nr:hypothetical protein [Bacillota bacterium]